MKNCCLASKPFQNLNPRQVAAADALDVPGHEIGLPGYFSCSQKWLKDRCATAFEDIKVPERTFSVDAHNATNDRMRRITSESEAVGVMEGCTVESRACYYTRNLKESCEGWGCRVAAHCQGPMLH